MVATALAYHPTVAHYLRFVATTGTFSPRITPLVAEPGPTTTWNKHDILTLSPTVGRDKVLRTLQYFSRFMAWYLLRTNHPKTSIAPFEAIKKQFGLTRKIMRVGKNVEHLKAASVALDAKTGPVAADPVLKYLTVGRQLGYALYLSFDMVTVLDATGIRKLQSVKRLQQNAYRAWCAGLVCSAIAGLYSLYRLKELEKRINKKDAEGAVEGKKLQK